MLWIGIMKWLENSYIFCINQRVVVVAWCNQWLSQNKVENLNLAHGEIYSIRLYIIVQRHKFCAVPYHRIQMSYHIGKKGYYLVPIQFQRKKTPVLHILNSPSKVTGSQRWRCLYYRRHMRTEHWKFKFVAATLYPRISKVNRDGLPPNTLTQIIAGSQRHLRNRCSDRTFKFFKENRLLCWTSSSMSCCVGMSSSWDKDIFSLSSFNTSSIMPW
jgi:hypothetical protein